MANRPASPLSQSWLDTQASLCPAGFLIYAGSLHDQCLGPEPLAKHSRFFGYKDFSKGAWGPSRAWHFLFMPHVLTLCV